MKLYRPQLTWWSGICYHKQQLEQVIKSTDVRNYAYILHDKDKEDSGEPKKAHYHFLVQFHRNVRGSWFNRFSNDDNGIVFYEPVYAPQGAYDYLIHDTPNAKADGKYLYSPSERISTIEKFEPTDNTDKNEILFEELCKMLDGKLSWHEFIKRNPKRVYSISSIKKTYEILMSERYGNKEPNKPNTNK